MFRYDNAFHVMNDVGFAEGLGKLHMAWALDGRNWPIPQTEVKILTEEALLFCIAEECCDDGEFTELMNQAWDAVNEKTHNPELEKLI